MYDLLSCNGTGLDWPLINHGKRASVRLYTVEGYKEGPLAVKVHIEAANMQADVAELALANRRVLPQRYAIEPRSKWATGYISRKSHH